MELGWYALVVTTAKSYKIVKLHRILHFVATEIISPRNVRVVVVLRKQPCAAVVITETKGVHDIARLAHLDAQLPIDNEKPRQPFLESRFDASPGPLGVITRSAVVNILHRGLPVTFEQATAKEPAQSHTSKQPLVEPVIFDAARVAFSQSYVFVVVQTALFVLDDGNRGLRRGHFQQHALENFVKRSFPWLAATVRNVGFVIFQLLLEDHWSLSS